MTASRQAGYRPDDLLALIREAQKDPAAVGKALQEAYEFIEHEGRAVELATVHYNAKCRPIYHVKSEFWYRRVKEEQNALFENNSIG